MQPISPRHDYVAQQVILHPNRVQTLSFGADQNAGSGQRWLGFRTGGRELVGYYSFAATPGGGGRGYKSALPLYRAVPAGVALIFAHIAQDRSFFNGFVLTNLEKVRNLVTLTAYDEAGTDVSHYLKPQDRSFYLTPYEKRVASFDAIFADGTYPDGRRRIAWVTIQADQALAGMELFGSLSPDGAILDRFAGLEAASLGEDTDLLLPLGLQGNQYTGFSMLNPSASPAEAVEMTFYDEAGVALVSQSLTIGAQEKLLGLYLNNTLTFPFGNGTPLVSLTNVTVGSVAIRSATPLRVFNLFGTLPGQSIPDVYDGLVARSPAARLGVVVPEFPGDASSHRLVLHSGTETSVTLSYFDAEGQSISQQELALAANAMTSLNLEPQVRYVQAAAVDGALTAYVIQDEAEADGTNQSIYPGTPIETAATVALSATLTAQTMTGEDGSPLYVAIAGEQLPLDVSCYGCNTMGIQVSSDGTTWSETVSLDGSGLLDTADPQLAMSDGNTYQLRVVAETGAETTIEPLGSLRLDIANFFPDAGLRAYLGNPGSMADLETWVAGSRGFLNLFARDEITSLAGIERLTGLEQIILERLTLNDTELDLSALTGLKTVLALEVEAQNPDALQTLILPHGPALQSVELIVTGFQRITFAEGSGSGNLNRLSLEACQVLEELDLSTAPLGDETTPFTLTAAFSPALQCLRLPEPRKRMAPMNLETSVSDGVFDGTCPCGYGLTNGLIEGDSISRSGTPVPIHRIAVDAVAGGLIEPDRSLFLPDGTAFTISATAYPSHTFSGWQGLAELAGEQTLTATHDMEITALFTERIYRVQALADPPDGATMTPASQEVAYGGHATITYNENENFSFQSWDGDMEDHTTGAKTITLRNITSDSTITARLQEGFLVTITADTGGTTDPAGQTRVTPGDSLTVTAIPDLHFGFVRWLADGNPRNLGEETITVNNIGGDTTIHAEFTPLPSYSVDVSIGSGSGTTNPTPGNYTVWEDDDTFVIEAVPDSGYEFVGWDGVSANASNDNPLRIDVRQDYQIRANFVKIHNITVNNSDNGSTNPPAGTYQVRDGDGFIIAANPREGYVLSEWLTSPSLGTNTRSTLSISSVEQDYTITPVFVEGTREYQVTIGASPTGGGTLDPGAGTYTYEHNQIVTIETEPNEGFVFDHWLLDGQQAGSSPRFDLTVTADHEVLAVFEAIPQYTVSISASPVEGGSTNPSGNLSVVEGDDLTISATPNANYNFTGWTRNGSPAGSDTTLALSSITANETIIANFQLIEHTLTINITGDGTVTTDPDLPSYPHGTEVEVTAVEQGNVFFDRFVVNGTTVFGNPITVTMNENVAVEAFFAGALQSDAVLDRKDHEPGKSVE